MNTRWEISSLGPAEVVSLSRAKEHLRVEHNAEDEYIQLLIASAVRAAENEMHIKLTRHRVTERFQGFPEEFRLRFSPAIKVDAVIYIDVEGSEQVWDEDAYKLLPSPWPSRVAKTHEGEAPSQVFDGFSTRILYECGYSDPASIPEDIIAAVLLILGHLYQNREDTPKRLPTAASHLLNPYRVNALWV